MTIFTLTLAAGPALAVAGAAAMALPIAIHLLSRWRRHPVVWGAMRFVIEAYRRHKHRLQLEQILLLLVRCLIPLVLGLALWNTQLRGLGGALGLGGTDRLICIVIDDAMSSAAPDVLAAATSDQAAAGPATATRFERLRNAALQIVDGLDRTDRIAIFRAGRPAQPLLASEAMGSFDHAAARSALEKLEPRYSRSDLLEALGQVRQFLSDPDRPFDVPADRVRVVLLSDFAQHVLQETETTASEGAPLRRGAAELAELSRLARLVVARPMTSVANAQIADLSPRRRLLLVEPERGATVPVRLRLRRYASETPDELSTLQLELLDAAGQNVIGSAQPEHRWSAGQTEAALSVDVPLSPAYLSRFVSSGTLLDEPASPPAGAVAAGASRGAHARASGAAVVVRGRLETDALDRDDARWAVVELRRRLQVGLVDAYGAARPTAAAAAADLSPTRWLTLALQPRTGDDAGSAVELQPMRADTLGAGAIGDELDALFVLRPDLVTPEGWVALKAFTQSGGLLWIVTPASEGSATWVGLLRRTFELNWQMEMDPSAAAAEGGAVLQSEHRPPQWLQMLAADWEALLRPVRVQQLLRVDAPADSVWMQTAAQARPRQRPAPPEVAPEVPPAAPPEAEVETDADAEAEAQAAPDRAGVSGAAVLLGTEVGRGYLLLLTTALEPGWSNLPTKPLFVPLVHETLRGVIGERGGSASDAVVSGDQPTLGGGWGNAQHLVRLIGPGATAGGPTMLLRRGDEGLTPIQPLMLPGVYHAQPTQGQLLAVNPDARGGDTRSTETQQLMDWLAGLAPAARAGGAATAAAGGRDGAAAAGGGAGWQWLEPDRPHSFLAQQATSISIGWPLLWIVLALVLLETCLARWFSHAQDGRPGVMRARLLRLVRGGEA